MMDMRLKERCEYLKELVGQRIAELKAVDEQLKQEFFEGRTLGTYALGIGSKAFSG